MIDLSNNPEHILCESIRGRENLSRQQAVNAVREYWNHPDNKSKRSQTVELEQEAAKGLAYYLTNPAEKSEEISQSWNALKNNARRDPMRLLLLKNILACIFVEGAREPGVEAKEALRAVLLDEFKPKKQGRRQMPGDYYVKLQLASAVRILRGVSAVKFSLSTNDTKAMSAYSVVKEATNQDFDVIRKASQSDRKRFHSFMSGMF